MSWYFPKDWCEQEPKLISPEQAVELWDEVKNTQLGSMIAFQQDLRLLPYSSEAEGELMRLTWISRFLFMWASMFHQYVKLRTEQIAAENAARKRSKKKQTSDDE